VNYTLNVQILPQEQIERVQPQPFASKPQNIYVDSGIHYQIAALMPGGNKLAVGDSSKIEFQTVAGKSLDSLAQEYAEQNLQPRWQITKGQERLQLKEDGTIVALEPGEATIQGTIPGIAANQGFLFIKALGQVGVLDAEGKINWDILGMVLFFGVSLYVNQLISGPQNSAANDQQKTVNQITPLIFSGMFLFFPLPAGVLMYMTIANAFQTVQTFILTREPLPENLQKLVEEQEKAEKGRDTLPFEPKRPKKKEKTSG
jgi:YidC/Oxa1 family membrane protein insertase